MPRFFPQKQKVELLNDHVQKQLELYQQYLDHCVYLLKQILGHYAEKFWLYLREIENIEHNIHTIETLDDTAQWKTVIDLHKFKYINKRKIYNYIRGINKWKQ